MNERRRFTPEEKMRIVLEGLSGTIEISEMCRKHQITTTINLHHLTVGTFL